MQIRTDDVIHSTQSNIKSINRAILVNFDIKGCKKFGSHGNSLISRLSNLISIWLVILSAININFSKATN